MKNNPGKIMRIFCYCPVNSLSLRDDCKDAGGSATQDAVAERVGERE